MTEQSTVSRAFEAYFACLGSTSFATALAQRPFLDLALGQHLATSVVSDREILEAASHHGNIGEKKQNLDARAQAEQAAVDERNEAVRLQLLETGKQYLDRHGIKYMICAKGKTGEEMLEILKRRLNNPTPEEWRAARLAMWQIFCKRIADEPSARVGSEVVKQAVDGSVVTSAAVSASWGSDIQLLQHHHADDGEETPEQPAAAGGGAQLAQQQQAPFAVGTFGRLVSAVFVLEFLSKHNIPLTASVDQILGQVGSTFRLNAEHITIEDIVAHSALEEVVGGGGGGDPLASSGGSALIDAKALASIVRLGASSQTQKPTSSAFTFSDANFVLLQHIVQMHALSCPGAASAKANTVAGLAGSFFSSMGLTDTSYAAEEGGSLTHGLRSTMLDLHRFVAHLGRAYHSLQGSAGISHDVARKAVYAFNRDFDHMNTYIGGAGGICNLLSVDGNKFIVNVGGTEERSIFSMHCFDGADKGKAFVVSTASSSSSSSSKRDLANCDLAISCIKQLGLRGFDESSSSSTQDGETTSQQQQRAIYRDNVMRKFTQERAEPIIERGPFSEFLARNFLNGARVAFCSNDKFARAENLVSDHDPLFDPTLFGRQGKVMDSWESVRHNIRDFDEAIFDVDKKSSSSKNSEEPIRYIYLTTKFHTGNHTPVMAVSVKLESPHSSSWQQLLPKMQMNGHSYRYIDLGASSSVKKKDIAQVRAEAYPDGGWTRLGLYSEGDLAAEERAKFVPLEQHLSGAAQSTRHEEAVPEAVKPLVEEYKTTKAEVAARLAQEVAAGAEVDAASLAFGGHIMSASDEHYAPAKTALSPAPPAGMFDGFESSRSRRAGSYEELRIGLQQPSVIHRIEVDCTYFVNNAPREIEIVGLLPVNLAAGSAAQPQQLQLVPRQKVKHFSGGIKEFITTATCTAAVEALVVRTFPCGGFNRLRAFTFRR